MKPIKFTDRDCYKVTTTGKVYSYYRGSKELLTGKKSYNTGQRIHTFKIGNVSTEISLERLLYCVFNNVKPSAKKIQDKDIVKKDGSRFVVGKDTWRSLKVMSKSKSSKTTYLSNPFKNVRISPTAIEKIQSKKYAKISNTEIAEEFGISAVHVGRIKRGVNKYQQV